MWLWRADYERLRDELVETRATERLLAEQAATHRTQTAFLVAQINQLTKERAVMVRHITKLEIPIPSLVAASTPPISVDDVLTAIGSNLFEDMGDDEARRQGLGWDSTGVVVPTSRRNNKDPHA